MNGRRRSLLAVLWWGAAGIAPALGPHEIAVLVNARSTRSIEIANHYASLRGIPEENVVFLDLPDSVLEPRARISPADFTRRLWNPARQALEERGLSDQILAWVYSVDFPVAVDTRPVLSLQGLTFLRNKVPDEQAVRQGQYASPLFSGPQQAREPTPPGGSLDYFKKILGEDMPLPSMMLGFMGSRGNEFARVLECLRAGAGSDGTRPAGAVGLVVSEDVRSRCRHWQFPAAAQDLAARGIPVRIVEDPARLPPALIGLMLGTPWIPRYNSTFLPGAWSDHLTSAAAIFDHYDQSKLTTWLDYGATASGGTIVEPYSIWTKFPSACFFVHYADGGTMLESLYLSLRCPLETLLVGEPLAAPWKTAGSVELGPPRAEPSGESVSFEVALRGWERADRYEALLDGRRIAWRVENGRAVVDTRTLADGVHTLRLVALSRGPIRQQVFGEAEFSVNRRGRAAEIEGLAPGTVVPLRRPLRLRVAAEGNPREVGILAGARWLARGAPGADLAVDPAQAGRGPGAWRAAALYNDGELVRGRPVRVSVESAVEGGDAPARASLFQALSWPTNGAEGPFGRLEGPPGILRVSDGGVALETTNRYDVATFKLPGAPAITAFEAEVQGSVDKARIWISQKAGLVFNYRNNRNFDFWALMGDQSAWVFGTCRGGTMKAAVARGAFIRPEVWHRLSVRQAEEGLEGYLNDDLVCRWPGAALQRKLPLGFMAGGEPGRFRGIAVSPPCAREDVELDPSP